MFKISLWREIDNATSYFTLISSKTLSKNFIFNHRGGPEGGGWLFCGKFRFLLSKLMFTHSASCWSHNHGVVETWNKRLSPEMYDLLHVWTYELPHELLNNLGLKILGNEELLRLFTWVFIDLMISECELVTYGFELVTREFELVTRGFELALLNFSSCF